MLSETTIEGEGQMRPFFLKGAGIGACGLLLGASS
jgi:hypothetical protein